MSDAPGLTDPEAIVLSVATVGEDLPALGNWKEIIEGLAAKGLMTHIADGFYRATDDGGRALDRYEADEAATRSQPKID